MATVEQFLEQIEKQALEARDRGDLAMIERLSANPAMRDYLNNVVFMATIKRADFAHWYADKWAHLEHMASDYYAAVQEREERKTLADELRQLRETVQQLIAVQSPKQKKALAEIVAEPEEEPETPADDPASEEAEETAPDAEEDAEK